MSTEPSTAPEAQAQPQVEPLRIWGIADMPEVEEGDDLATLLLAALHAQGLRPEDGDVLVVPSKVVSKALGLRLPAEQRIGAVLAESRRVLAERQGPHGLTRIVESLAGPVLAGAGIDASNTGPDDRLLLLPRDPDASATALRAALLRGAPDPAPIRFGVILSDSAGRPWRAGLADIAIGAAGFAVTEDLRGGRDTDGQQITVTVRAVADELAGAADLVKGKCAGVPAALVRGWRWPEGSGFAGTPDIGTASSAEAQAQAGSEAMPQAESDGGARSLVRSGPGDWFALGHVEAVRSALGVPPGSTAALDVGLPASPPDGLDARVERARRVALVDGLGTIPVGHPRAHLAGARPTPGSARIDLLQHGLVVEAPDDATVGVVTARLLAALAGESVPAAWARTEPPDQTHGPRALVVFTGTNSTGLGSGPLG